MSSKKYKNKTCVYCAVNPSTTGDHVFARTFFAEDQRADLPQVRACAPCNKAKSDLEHYLATVLLFVGQHADAGRMLENEGPRKLAKYARLHRELSEGVEYVTDKNAAGQSLAVNMLFPFDSEKLHTPFSYIVRGLLWYHWQVILDEHHDVRVSSLSRLIENAFAPLFEQFTCQRADGNLANGTFRYRGRRRRLPGVLVLWFLGLWRRTFDRRPGAGRNQRASVCAHSPQKRGCSASLPMRSSFADSRLTALQSAEPGTE